MSSLGDEIVSSGGIYKRYSNSLQKLGITKFDDFLYHIPSRYNDFSVISKISDIQEGEVITVKGQVEIIKNEYTRRRIVIQKAKVSDDTGSLSVIWFNQPYIAKTISPGDLISLSGKVEKKGISLQMLSPEFELTHDQTLHTGRLVPVYPETYGISSKWLRRQVFKLLNENKNELKDYLPKDIIENNKLESLFDALSKIHFPKNLEEVDDARARLSFDELFLTQLSSAIRKIEWEKKLKGYPIEIKKYEKKIDKFIKKLPFTLTNAQRRTVNEIFSDMSEDKPMNRLLEGDVGSGKTVVATIAMYLTHLNGYQSVIMAPTEILAQQHYKTISTLLEPLGLKITLRTRSNKKNGLFDILIGTHAVIHGKIKFDKLGLVIIDEQHRFGVEQRSLVRKKGENPHVLTMTATPIPRTIALTMYGDLDLSILDEMPMGRKEIKTWVVEENKRTKAYDWIKKHIDHNKGQVFIICPFIEESENMATVKAAVKEFEFLKKDVFKKYKIGLIHGKLKSKEKESVLNDFKDKSSDVLVATPVVEVGIDIPGAEIIVIETAERFGLAQLHQLRGRVGRSDRQSYCLLFTDSKNPYTTRRLKAMEHASFGAELAELDLKLRGPGEIYGTAQHGRDFLKIASFSDFDLIQKTRSEAQRFVSKLNKYPKLKQKIEEINVSEVSPD